MPAMKSAWSSAPRLPFPYRAEAEVVAASLATLQGRLDWPAVMAWHGPGCKAARATPAPFWAMESLLREYPISSAEGLALMRLAEALLRVPDAETAIALTADQLGRADFDAGAEGPAQDAGQPVGQRHRPVQALPARSGGEARADAAPGRADRGGATVRAIQLLGRQFVWAAPSATRWARPQASARPACMAALQLRHAGRRCAHRADAAEYLAAYQRAIQAIAGAPGHRPPGRGRDGSRSSSARCTRATRTRSATGSFAELLPRVWRWSRPPRPTST
jgi:RHH-type proline utilization regulon transcriptional repressor/proline dehydrogenase/delta 1-pyrroline-5-carboxylate dehydrogenase